MVSVEVAEATAAVEEEVMAAAEAAITAITMHRISTENTAETPAETPAEIPAEIRAEIRAETRPDSKLKGMKFIRAWREICLDLQEEVVEEEEKEEE